MLYEIPQLEHVEPKTVEEAVYWLKEYGPKAKIIAGGTDLLGLIKDNVKGPMFPMPQILVDISKIPEISSIDFRPGKELIIGSNVTLRALANTRAVSENYPILAQAANSVATPQIRNVGTVGGNLCQRPWCWYFRHPAFPCFKKGGKQCYAIPGEHKYYFSTMGIGTCVMSHPSDLAPAFVALDAKITVAGPSGKRDVPISKFFNGPKDVFDNILKTDEMIVKVTVPPQFREYSGAFLKDRIRDTWDLSLASAAVAIKISGDACTDARVCLGGIVPFRYRSEAAELVLKQNKISEETARLAAEAAYEKAKPLPMTKYKVQIGKVITRRAILKAFNM